MMLDLQILQTYLRIAWISFGLIKILNLSGKPILLELEVAVKSVFKLCNIFVQLFSDTLGDVKTSLHYVNNGSRPNITINIERYNCSNGNDRPASFC